VESTLPTRLGRYELLAEIGSGGMAVVHLARRDDGELVALKTIREEHARNDEFLAMLLDEAQIVARLRHPNIVRYHELGRQGRHAFIAMELLSGQSLWTVWEACRARGVRLRYDVLAWIGARVADALHYAHELADEQGRPLGIVHRDVNATNVFVTYDGEVKVIDFGLAKAANRNVKTAAGTIKGKVAYMSPEQAMGAAVDRRTDVFALGATLWELACDRRLFKQDDEVKTLERVHAARVPDPTRLVAGFPPELWRVLERALEREKQDRFPTAEQLARELDAIAGPAVTSRVVADVMQSLFPAERARQAEWIVEASSRHAGQRVAPLRSTGVSSVAPATVRLAETAPSEPSTARRLGLVAIVIVVVVVAVIAGALVLR
jgi:serine/threonine protein kinase